MSRVTALALRGLARWEDAVRPLDTFVREVRTILSNGIRIDAQFAGEVKKGVRYVGGETLTVATTLKTTPAAVLCMSASEARTGAVGIITGSIVTWTYNNGALAIYDISGLAAGTDYLVTLWIVEG